MSAVKVKELLQKKGLPTYFIPLGFETGFYDENLNMYNPQGIPFKTTQTGGHLKFNKSFDISDHGKQYLATGQGIYHSAPMYHHSVLQTKVRNDKVEKYVDNNISKLKEIRNKWREDHTAPKGTTELKKEKNKPESLSGRNDLSFRSTYR